MHPIEYFTPWFSDPISVADNSVAGVVDALNRHPMASDQTAQDYVMPLRRCRDQNGRFRIFGENQDTYYCFVRAGEELKPNPPVYFESCLDLVDDYGLDPSQVIDGDHIQVSPTFTQFLWHMIGHHICLRCDDSGQFAHGVSGLTFADSVELDETFTNPIGIDFPAGYSPYFANDTICIPDWGVAFRNKTAHSAFVKCFAPNVTGSWG